MDSKHYILIVIIALLIGSLVYGYIFKSNDNPIALDTPKVDTVIKEVIINHPPDTIKLQPNIFQRKSDTVIKFSKDTLKITKWDTLIQTRPFVVFSEVIKKQDTTTFFYRWPENELTNIYRKKSDTTKTYEIRITNYVKEKQTWLQVAEPYLEGIAAGLIAEKYLIK